MLSMRKRVTAFATVLMGLILSLPASAAPTKAILFQAGKVRWEIKTSLRLGANT